MTKLQSKQSKEDRLKLARPQNIDALSPTTASTSRASLFLVLLPENYTGAASTATTTVKAAVALAGARSVVIFAVTGKLHGSCVNCHYNSEGARSVVMSAFLLLSPPIAAVGSYGPGSHISPAAVVQLCLGGILVRRSSTSRILGGSRRCLRFLENVVRVDSPSRSGSVALIPIVVAAFIELVEAKSY